MADSTDAKLQTLTELFKGKTGTDWLGYNRLFESNLRRASEDKFNNENNKCHCLQILCEQWLFV